MAEQPKKLGRFEVESELGRGAMGVVYKGLDPKIGRPVALKTLLFDSLAASEDAMQSKERFLVEAKATGQLAHPNILTIYDAGEEGNIAYIAMEYLKGGDLQDMINAGKFTGYGQILDIVRQIAEGLDHAHENQIVHRDIKPANIMMMNGKIPKIADFGLARLQDSNLTTTGTVLGTPSYMAPEQVRGRSLDGRADLWALGVILYEMLTGEKAFRGESITSVIYSVVNEEPIPPRDLVMDLPAGIDDFMKKALAKVPEERFQTGAEFADAIKQVAEGKVGSALKFAAAGHQAAGAARKGAASVSQAWKDEGKRPMMMAGLVGGVLLLLIIIVVSFTGSGDEAVDIAKKSQAGPGAPPKVEGTQKVDEAKQAEEAKKQAEAKKADETKKQAEAKKADETKKQAEAKKADETKKQAEAKKARDKRLGTAKLSILSTPSKAKIFINGNMVKGKTPYTNRKYKKKTYSIVVAKAGYNDWSGTVNLKKSKTISAKLRPGRSAMLADEERAIDAAIAKASKKKKKKRKKTASGDDFFEFEFESEKRKRTAKEEKASLFSNVFNPEKAGNVGNLIVLAKKGDSVTINGKKYKGGKIQLNGTVIGKHNIFIKRKGYKKPFLKTVTVKKGFTTKVKPIFK